MNFQDFINKGISVIPLTKDQRPAMPWKEFQTRLATSEECAEWESKGFGIGIVAGNISNGLHCIDVDTKYALAGTNLSKDFKEEVDKCENGLLNKAIWQKTRSGGYHCIYRTDAETRNEKYAQRPATPQEAEKGEKVKVLLESRGTGGYFIYYGDPVVGSWDNIPAFSDLQNEIVKACARSFNQVFKAPKAPKEERDYHSLETTPWGDYAIQTDTSVTLDLLLKHGWDVVVDMGDRWYLGRPGKNGKSISASLGVIGEAFWVWSTSTEFEALLPYDAAQVRCVLEYDGDWKACGRALSEEGYGEKLEEKEKRELVNELIGEEHIELTPEEEALIAGRIKSSEEEMNEYVEFAKTYKSFPLPDHLSHLRTMMKYIQPGEYVGWSAPSGVGKTSSTRIVFKEFLNMTEQEGLFGSMELKSRDLAIRNAQEMRPPDDGDLVDRDITKDMLLSNESFRNSVIEEYKRFHSLDSSYNITTIFRIAEVFKRKLEKQGKKLGVVCIDFVQMADGGHDISKQPEIATAMKMWAKKLDVIVVGILQINSSKGKYEEPYENDISGHKALFQTCDYNFMMWKSPIDHRRIHVKQPKERNTLEGYCDLVQTGMQLHSEPYKPDTAADIAKQAGNRGLE